MYLAAVEDGKSLKGVLKEAEAETGRRVGCVMSDVFLWFAGALAEEMGCRGTRETDVVGRENDVVKFIPGFSAMRLGDLPTGILFGNLESPFAMMLYKMGRALPKATAVAVLSFEDLDPEINQDLKSKFKMLLNFSPYNSLPSSSPPPSLVSDDYGCIPWLDNHKTASVAYIGFGTAATPPPVEIISKELFPEGFMERTSELGKVVPWAPQERVLAHGSLGVFVTHCGWNSVLESIVAGVPIIGRPLFGDHHINTWMVENVWKIGVRVEGGVFTKSGTISALELVLSHEKGKEMKEQVGMFKELALKAAGPGGSSAQNLRTLLEVVTKYNL
ncbi:hypothetical protein RHMOL_Rhmol09G0210000 [Rhododendron molle]|uniref:Uncharacterized protein n=1 Tax=Rhododendron molle TaxID=49168 RepID=A0ACC0MH31_RHOML|nr:hypothetical protein RHMOL_Rhmol09G0210000 [Rhododendron molle]